MAYIVLMSNYYDYYVECIESSGVKELQFVETGAVCEYVDTRPWRDMHQSLSDAVVYFSFILIFISVIFMLTFTR